MFLEKYFWGPGSVQTRRADALWASVSRRLCTKNKETPGEAPGVDRGWLLVVL